MQIVLLGAWCAVSLTASPPRSAQIAHAAYTAQIAHPAQIAQTAPAARAPQIARAAQIANAPHVAQTPWTARESQVAPASQRGQVPQTAQVPQVPQAEQPAPAVQIAPSPPLMGLPANGEVPPDYFKIDGSKHPEQVPDHWAWRAAFLKLATIKQAGEEANLHPTLRLSDADAEVLYKEAIEQPRRDAECLRTILAKREEARVQQTSPAALERALLDITLDCRTKDLDAADRVLDAMSLEGRDILRAWVDAKRRNTVVFVPISDKHQFRLPR